MKTLKIEVPEGYEIDKDKSTFEEIVFKPVKKDLPKSWVELGKVNGYYTNTDSCVQEANTTSTHTYHRNIFATESQAKASIALAQLSQLREVYRQGWEPDWNDINAKYVIERCENEMTTETYHSYSSCFLSFQSPEIRDEFLANFKDLIEEAAPLLFG